MDPTNTVAPRGPGARNSMGWILIAVILGEGIWNLIVSVMNNLIVPWLGDVMGSSSGLPTSFTQRPYDYPALFVSVLELCIAGIVAAILNYFLRRNSAAHQPMTPTNLGPASLSPAKATLNVPERPFPQPFPPAQPPAVVTPAYVPPAVVPPAVIPRAITPPVTVAAPPPPPEIPAPTTFAAHHKTVSAPERPSAPDPASGMPVAKQIAPKPAPPAPKAAPAKPAKPKPVYYNIVGEPMPSDED